MKSLLPKVYRIIKFSNSDDVDTNFESGPKYPNPFKDHPKYGKGHKAIAGLLILENLLYDLKIASYADFKLGTHTGPIDR